MQDKPQPKQSKTVDVNPGSMYLLNGMKNLICAQKGSIFQQGSQTKPYGALALQLISPQDGRQFEAVIVIPDEHVDSVCACVAELSQRMKISQKKGDSETGLKIVGTSAEEKDVVKQ